MALGILFGFKLFLEYLMLYFKKKIMYLSAQKLIRYRKGNYFAL